MKRLTRAAAAVAACLFVTGGLLAPEAQAQGLVVLEGAASIDCYGCGFPGHGTASLKVTGVAGGTAKALATATMSFTISGDCPPVTGSVSGTFGGGVNGSFAGNRVGAVTVITTSGDIAGTGLLVFVPTGVPTCGGPMNATVVGTIAGN